MGPCAEPDDVREEDSYAVVALGMVESADGWGGPALYPARYQGACKIAFAKPASGQAPHAAAATGAAPAPAIICTDTVERSICTEQSEHRGGRNQARVNDNFRYHRQKILFDSSKTEQGFTAIIN